MFFALQNFLHKEWANTELTAGLMARNSRCQDISRVGVGFLYICM